MGSYFSPMLFSLQTIIGLDCRVFSVDVLADVDKLCSDPMHRVHGSTYIYVGEGKEKYKSLNLSAPNELNYPEWRWTLDTKEDLEFLRAITDSIGAEITTISANDLTSWLLEHPEIISINSKVRQRRIEEG